MKNILVSGGAGYIGSVLVRLCLQSGYHVRVLDNLRFGGESMIELLDHPAFEFVKGDTRDSETLARAIEGIEAVVHLAAIVGDPACAKEPELARAVNLEATQQFYEIANRAGVTRFVLASTCSNYGKMKDPHAYVDEQSELAPVSLYAETKVAAEQFLLIQNRNRVCKPICLRFATVYGPSPRIRFDLTVNEFTKELALGRELIVFGEQFWRPYAHVADLSRSVLAVLEAAEEKVAFEVFNVGDTQENYTKQMIVEVILKQLSYSKIRYVQKAEDPRDYKVCFEKIQNHLGFKITRRVPDGVRQIIQVVQQGLINNPDDAKYKNS